LSASMLDPSLGGPIRHPVSSPGLCDDAL